MGEILREKEWYRMPKIMFPSKEAFEELGFIFFEYENMEKELNTSLNPSRNRVEKKTYVTKNMLNNIFYKATLPEGWNICGDINKKHIYLCDSFGVVRARIKYFNQNGKRNTSITLVPRYGVYSEINNNVVHIYFGNEKENLFDAGYIDFNNASGDTLLKKMNQRNKLEELARIWGEKNYPDYMDINAYQEEVRVR